MTKQDIEQITEIVHNTIFQFFDVCGDNEEVPISEKDKLLLRVNKAVCKGIRELEQVDEPVVKSESVDETVDAISRQAVLDTIGKMTCPCGDGTSIYDEGNFIHNETLSDVHQAVLDLPSVTAERTGHWIDTGSGQECSECHEIQHGYDNYRFFCPVCGCRMSDEGGE